MELLGLLLLIGAMGAHGNKKSGSFAALLVIALLTIGALTVLIGGIMGLFWVWHHLRWV